MKYRVVMTNDQIKPVYVSHELLCHGGHCGIEHLDYKGCAIVVVEPCKHDDPVNELQEALNLAVKTWLDAVEPREYVQVNPMPVPRIGDRVRVNCYDRFPTCLIESTEKNPVLGTVSYVGKIEDDYYIGVKLDIHRPELDPDHNNEIAWYPNCGALDANGWKLTAVADFWGECTLIPHKLKRQF